MSVVKAGEDLSVNEKEFILEALRVSDYRADGRTARDTRPLRVTYARGEAQASAEVQLGKTRVLTVVTSELQPPYPDRPTEGFLTLNVEYSPMAALGIDNARSAPALVEVDRVIERCLRQSRALDVEALCVVAGHKVWSLRCDIRVLDDGGNVVDAAALATVAALLHFRLPEVSVTQQAAPTSSSNSNDEEDDDDGGKPTTTSGASGGGGGEVVIVHHSFEKEPSALPIHHVPVCVSFGLFHEGTIAAVDPTNREEAVMGGRLTYAINVHKELCALQKLGGVPLAPDDMMRWCEVAQSKVGEWHALIQQSLAEADARAKQDRLDAIRGTAPTAPSSFSLPPTTPAAAAAPEQEQGIAHLDFAELHVPIKVREESEKPPPPTAEEEGRRLARLEKAAEDAERYRLQQEQAAAASQAAKAAAAAASKAAAAVAQEGEGEGEGMDVEDKEEGGGARNGRGKQQRTPTPPPKGQGKGKGVRGGKKGGAAGSDSDDDEEEETTAVVVSEFAPAPASAQQQQQEEEEEGESGGGGGAKGKRASTLAARRAKLSLEGRAEEDEGGGDGEEGYDDLTKAVKKPRLAKASSAGGGKKAAARGGGGARKK